MSEVTRTGILGGAFDPVHQGHLDAAEAARRALQLDEVLFIPTRVTPHRAVAPRASAYHRFAMLALATAHQETWLISDAELGSSNPSYTSLTLQRMALAGYDPAHLFFITGADAFAEIAIWYDFPAVLERSHFAVVSRPGYPVSQLRSRLPGLAGHMKEVSDASGLRVQAGGPTLQLSIWLIDATTKDASSNELRRRLTAREPLAGLTPADVETYIRRHRLYMPDRPAATDLHEPN